MFIALLLIAPALCEWVEISQHHVRKPTRTHFRLTEKVTEEYLEDTTSTTKIYLNQSLAERPWRGNVNKVPKLGNIQRVQLDDSPIKAPNLKVNAWENSVNGGSIKSVNKNNIAQSVFGANSDLVEIKGHKTSSSAAENNRHRTTNGPANIEKAHRQNILNKESFQETPTKNNRTKLNLSNKNNRPSNEIDRASSNIPGLRNPGNEVVNDLRTSATKQKNKVTQRLQIFKIDKNNKNSLFITEAGTTNIRRHDYGYFADTNEKSSGKVTGTVFLEKNKVTENISIKDETPKRDDNNVNRDGIIRSKLTNHEIVTKVEKPVDDDLDATVTEDNDDPKIVKTKPEIIYSDDENFGQEENMAASMNKGNSMENLMAFMKVVAETIKKNTRRSVNSKTRYLTNLKNTILANIAARIDAAWPDDEPRKRMARAAHATPRGHLEIPSSESALMTISFLTFAVFLIKLVLQVIQTYKNKAMMVTPAVLAVGRVASKRSSKP